MKTNFLSRQRLFHAIIFATGLLFSGNSFAQTSPTAVTVFMDWATSSGSQNMFQKSATRSIPGTTDIVVCGSTINGSGNYDILTTKYNGSGQVIWSQQYNGAGNGNDIGMDVRVASNGEIYVCGTYYKDATDSCNAIVIKYSGAGAQRWTATYNGSGSRNDGYTSLLVSGASVVAVGSCWSTSNQYDMLTRRLDTAGTTVWTTTADQAGLADGAVSLSNRSGSIFVTGGVQTSSTAYKIATWKITPSSGAITSTTLSSASSIAMDRVTDVQEDASGYVYVAGSVYSTSTGFDYKIFKYDANLALQWSQTWNGADSLEDQALGLEVDASGNVYLTGYTTTTNEGRNYATVKFNSSGTQQWVEYHNGKSNRDDEARAIVTDASGNVYVSGFVKDVGLNEDYYTIKYNSSGTSQWEISYNSMLNWDDRACSIAIDTVGAIIVTGQSTQGTSRSYYTVRYYERSVTTPNDGVEQSGLFAFLENKGQLLKTDSTSASSVEYYTMHGEPRMYFADNAISYAWRKMDQDSSTTDTCFRVDMFLKNANINVTVKPLDERSEYYNFFNVNPGARPRAKTYERLIYTEPWTNIDAIFGSNNLGVKCYFEVKPGGNPSDVSWQYVGANSVAVNGSGGLELRTSLDTLVQRKATVFQIDGSGNYVSLAWQPTYSIATGNILTFSSLGTYNSAYTLVFAIDWGAPPSPAAASGNLVWNTYYGADGNEFFWDVTTDPVGRPYYTGYSDSNGPTFPAGSGQGSILPWAGGYDAVVIKFDTMCAPQWTNYFGGTGTETSYGITTDPFGNVTVCGYSLSNAIPFATPTGAYKDSINTGNGWDAYIAKFDSTGQTLQWSTFYGGNSSAVFTVEQFERCRADASGNLFFIGRGADSLTPTYTKTGAYNLSTDGGAIIAKFTNNGVRDWITRYYGGIGDVEVDNANNVYITGGAASGIPIVNKGGGVKSTPDGTDAYVAEFAAASDTVIWSTYFGGWSIDGGNAIAIDDNNSAVYVTGQTRSDSAHAPLFPMVDYNTSSSLDFLGDFSSTLTLPNTSILVEDAFVTRFDMNNGAMLWSTYYGGYAEDFPRTAVVDADGNLYIGGYTRSGTTQTTSFGHEKIDFPQWGAPAGYYVKTDITGWEGADADGFLAVFDPNEQLVWTSYYGDGLLSTTYASSNSIQGLALANDSDLYIASYSQYGYSQSTLDAQKYLPISSLTDYYQTQPGQTNTAEGLAARLRLKGNAALGIPSPTVSTFAGDFVIFPNPSADNIYLNVNVPQGEKAEIIIYDMLGQIIYQQTLGGFSGNVMLNIDVTQWGDAVYNVQLRTAKGAIAHRFVKTSK